MKQLLMNHKFCQWSKDVIVIWTILNKQMHRRALKYLPKAWKFLNFRRCRKGCFRRRGRVWLTKNVENRWTYLKRKIDRGRLFTVEFYKHFFDLVGDLLASLNGAYELGRLSVSQRRGINTLLPKEDVEFFLLLKY